MAKFYTEQKHRETMNKVDMLKGCINRICVTDDLDECDKLLSAAMCQLSDIYQTNKEKLLERKYGDKETREANHKKMLDEMFCK